MLKDWWEQKKHLIQLVGILTGVGALFLSIAPPDNILASQALANIQLVWLIIITIGCGFLFISFHNFSVGLEKHYGQKWNLNLKETVSLLIFMTFIYLISNLWIYILNLYSHSLLDFLANTNIGWMSILTAIFFYFFWKFLEKFSTVRGRILFMICSYFVLSGVGSFLLLAINHQGFTFNLWTWLFVFGLFFLLLVVATVWNELRISKKTDKGA